MGLNPKEAKHTTSEAGRQQGKRQQKHAPDREDPAPWRPSAENEHRNMICKGDSKRSHEKKMSESTQQSGGLWKRQGRTLSWSGPDRREQPLRPPSRNWYALSPNAYCCKIIHESTRETVSAEAGQQSRAVRGEHDQANEPRKKLCALKVPGENSKQQMEFGHIEQNKGMWTGARGRNECGPRYSRAGKKREHKILNP